MAFKLVSDTKVRSKVALLSDGFTRSATASSLSTSSAALASLAVTRNRKHRQVTGIILFGNVQPSGAPPILVINHRAAPTIEVTIAARCKRGAALVFAGALSRLQDHNGR
jgi:hypothetical protein